MQLTHIVEESWAKLLRDYDRRRFTPEEEADLQCYLYALCLRRLKTPRRIHAEEITEKGKFTDLSLGLGRLPVEIKWGYYRNRKQWSGSWARDVRKLSKIGGRRKPIFVLFFTYGPHKRWGKVRPLKVSEEQRTLMNRFIEWANRRHNVKVLTNLFPR